MPDTTDRPLLTAADALELDPLIDDLVFLDIHLRTGTADCEGIFRSGHLPEARFADLGRDFLGTDGPLPDIDVLQDRARGWGLGPTTHVIVYAGRRYQPAARAWWTLRWAGVQRVSVLDGGMPAWLESGGPLELGSSNPAPGAVTLWPGAMPVVDRRQLPAIADDGVVLDARNAVAFRTAQPESRLPGAVNSPSALNLDDNGRLLPPDALRDYYLRLGVTTATRVAVYSSAGIAAALTILALETIGVRAALLPGGYAGSAGRG